MNPVATRYTLEFVLASLPAGATRVLEVGCGAGELASELQQQGFAVLAIDADPEAVAAARAKGVDARHGEWPYPVEGRFDAVLFTRSLHHIHDLDGAVRSAAQALVPEGRVIVEDFRAEGGSGHSSDWYRKMLEELHDGGALVDDADLTGLLAKIEPDDHDQELHSSAAIEAALGRAFDVTASDAAYYFRYLEPVLREPGAGQWLLDVERELIATGEIDALGRRFVAR